MDTFAIDSELINLSNSNVLSDNLNSGAAWNDIDEFVDQQSNLFASNWDVNFQDFQQDPTVLSLPEIEKNDKKRALQVEETEIKPKRQAILPTVFDEDADAKVNQVLEENLQLVNLIRENLVHGNINENVELMKKFHGNLSYVFKVYV
jgi:hypothetical protein